MSGLSGPEGVLAAVAAKNAAPPCGVRVPLMPLLRVRAASLVFWPVILPALMSGAAQAEVEPDNTRQRRLVVESPCQWIRQVVVRGLAPLGLPDGWAVPVLAGPAADDAPEGRCLGVNGILLFVCGGWQQLLR